VVRKLIIDGSTHATVLAVVLPASATVLMLLLGAVKLKLGRQLGSGATAGEGVQNIMFAVQAAAALVAVAGAGIGLGFLDRPRVLGSASGSWIGLAFLDPIAALVIAGIALKEGRDGWRGTDSCCTPMPELDAKNSSIPTRQSNRQAPAKRTRTVRSRKYDRPNSHAMTA
jgi:divalent metal cation (Fe/Co/Zn/Cd) transporter